MERDSMMKHHEIIARWRSDQIENVLSSTILSKRQQIEATRSALHIRDFELCKQIIDRAFELFPDDFYFLVLASEFSEECGDIIDAWKYARLASEIDRSHILALFRAARLSIRVREFKKATYYFEKFIDVIMQLSNNHYDNLATVALSRIYSVECQENFSHIIEIATKLALQKRLVGEVMPLLSRVLLVKSDKERGKIYRMAYVKSDARRSEIYGATDCTCLQLPTYKAKLEDLPQFWLKLEEALVSTSAGLIISEDSCFAVDHGFSSDAFESEFQCETKSIMTQDQSIIDYNFREGIIRVDIDNHLCSIEQDVFIVPLGHYTNFGHFMHDIAMLKYAFDRVKYINPSVRLAVYNDYKTSDFRIFYHFIQILFGEPLHLSKSKSSFLRFRSVHLVTLAHQMWPSKAKVSIGPAKYLRKFLSSEIHNRFINAQTKKIYIARRSSNEDIMKKVEDVFFSKGFRIVDLEILDINQYCELFAGATHLAGVHGAGLMNFVLSESIMQVLEIKRAGGNWHSISAVAHAMGVDFQSIEQPKAENILDFEMFVTQWSDTNNRRTAVKPHKYV